MYKVMSFFFKHRKFLALLFFLVTFSGCVFAATILEQLKKYNDGKILPEKEKVRAEEFVKKLMDGVASKITSKAKLDKILANWVPAFKTLNFKYVPASVSWQDVILGRKPSTDCGNLLKIFQAAAEEVGVDGLKSVTKDCEEFKVESSTANIFLTDPNLTLIDGTKGPIKGSRFLFENHTWGEFVDENKTYVYDALFGICKEITGTNYWKNWLPLIQLDKSKLVKNKLFMDISIKFEGTTYWRQANPKSFGEAWGTKPPK